MPHAKCSKCNKLHDRNGRYCRACHNQYMRAHRKSLVKENRRLRETINRIMLDMAELRLQLLRARP